MAQQLYDISAHAIRSKRAKKRCFYADIHMKVL